MQLLLARVDLSFSSINGTRTYRLEKREVTTLKLSRFTVGSFHFPFRWTPFSPFCARIADILSMDLMYVVALRQWHSVASSRRILQPSCELVVGPSSLSLHVIRLNFPEKKITFIGVILPLFTNSRCKRWTAGARDTALLWRGRNTTFLTTLSSLQNAHLWNISVQSEPTCIV